MFLHQKINGTINCPIMKQYFKQFILFLVFSLCIYPAWSAHIIGGNMTYRCFSNNVFEITLLLYRDCNCFNCADFDANANIGVYRCGNAINCGNLSQNNSILSISAPLFSRSTVLNPDIPGFQFPDQCLQQGAYRFTVTLPPSNEVYYISYQRCCRPETVSNITNPRNVGMTIYTEIQPNAAAVCNNSAKFRESINPVFCLGETFEIDHSAADADGDSLVYSICSAFKGAGIAGGPDMPGGNATSCIGLVPTPACPPPYNVVDYASGFSGGNPLGSDSQLSINPQSGLITVNPSIAGQFLVTICVKEYRNGSLINNSFREFTYLAADCQTTSTYESQKHSKLKLFPNPANDFINITLTNYQGARSQIHIFNSFGQCVDMLELQSNDQKVDTSKWAAGLYNLLLLEDGKVVQSEKFVKI